jgi:hypothetical protein
MFSIFPSRFSRIQQEQTVQQEQKLTEEDIRKLNNIKLWKENDQDPITKERVELSIVPTSAYVKLYKKSIEILISIILRKSSSVILTIKDCKYIRKCLPDVHARNDEYDHEYFYDHLFTKYFLKHKKKYDNEYCAYGTDVFLYLQLYSILKRKSPIPEITLPISHEPQMSLKKLVLKPLPYKYIKKILNNNNLKPLRGGGEGETNSSEFNQDDKKLQMNFLTNNINHSLFLESELSIQKIMGRLSNDINHIFILKFTKENYSHVINNFTTLKFVEKIYNISDNLKDNLKEDINEYINTTVNVNDFFRTHLVDKKSSEYFPILEDIYNKIILLYDYYFPYFIHDGIYETNCNGKKDEISLDEFNYDTNNHAGKVTIIPDYFNNKMVNKCYITEDIYNTLLFDINNNRISTKPHNREEFTKGDIEHIVNQLKILIQNYNEDESKNGLLFLKKIFSSQLDKVGREIIKIKYVYGYYINKEFDLKVKNQLKKALEALLKYIDEQSKKFLKEILNDPKFIYFRKVNKRKRSIIFKSTEGDIERFIKKLEIDIENYNYDESENGLIILKDIFSSQLDKVKKELGLSKRLKKEELQKLYEYLEYLLKKIDDKNIDDKETINKISENDDFTYFIDETKKESINVVNKTRSGIADEIKSKIEKKFFSITDNYNQQIVEHQTESSEFKIIGYFTYFLNINLGTDENKRIFQHSFLDIPIFNNEKKNETLYTYANSSNSPIIVVANSPILYAVNYPNSTILDDIKKLMELKKSPEEVYNEYIIFFKKNFTSGGRKKRIVNTTSNKKSGRKKKTI